MFLASQLQAVKNIISQLGWNIFRSGIRAEYNECDVVATPPEGMLDEIPGYISRQPKIDYMILQSNDDMIHLSFSSYGMVTPFITKKFELFVDMLQYGGIAIQLP